jgi:4-hydroxy-tetrahydrodipicolinate synthase
MKQLFTGAGVALITPFDRNTEIDAESLEYLVDNQINNGIDYLVALGTTAETPTLSEKEKKQVVEIVKLKNNNRVPLVVGFGGNNTKKIIEQINDFDFNGISGILSVTPYYNKPTQEGMYRHFMEIAEASPVPLILYNVPSRTGVNLEASTVTRLVNASEKFAAVKEASGNLAQMSQIIKETPNFFTLISGDDGIAVPVISIGGKGVISVIANALPAKLSSMIHCALEGNYREAERLHQEMSDLFTLLFKEGNPGGVKALMHKMGLIQNVLRLPLYQVSSKLYGEIETAWHQLI